MKLDLGINIGAGTWQAPSNGTPVPGGINGREYTYATRAEIDTAHAAGVKAVRMGAAVSRFYASPTATTLNPDVAALLSSIDYARSLGMRVYFCFHEYGYAYGRPVTVADVPHTIRCFEALAKYKTDAGFIPCSWNEPHILTGATYWPIIAAFRQQMRDAGWSGLLGLSAENWAGFGQIGDQVPKFAAMNDPKIVVEGHYYHDLPASQWASWSGPGHGSGVWALTEADIGTPKFAEVVNTNWDRAFKGSLDKARAAGLKLFIGETSIPFGPVGNAVRRMVLPKFEAYADVLLDRLLWLGAATQSAGDANRLIGQGSDGKLFATPLLLDEVAARREIDGVAAPVPVEPAPVPVPVPVPPASDLRARLDKARLEVNGLVNAASRARYAIDKAIEGIG